MIHSRGLNSFQQALIEGLREQIAGVHFLIKESYLGKWEWASFCNANACLQFPISVQIRECIAQMLTPLQGTNSPLRQQK